MPTIKDMLAMYFTKSGQYRNRRANNAAWIERAFAKFGY